MAGAEISSGICGFTTTVTARPAGDGQHVTLTIESDCPNVQQLAAELLDLTDMEVDAFREITYRGEGPHILRLAARHLRHTACPVPSGLIKAIEVAAGLALPADVAIRLSS